MITVTDRALQHIKDCIDKRHQGIGIRLKVKPSGCSGLAYGIEFADSVAPEDKEFVFDSVKVVIDSKSLVYLDKSEIDFVKEGLQTGFQIRNPNEVSRCGCGESFNV